MTSVQAETVQEELSYKEANFNVRSGKGPEQISQTIIMI